MQVVDTECVVIGAGVIGLAIARELSNLGKEVVVLEKEAAIGTETSSRNSEVIHAGIYYKPASNKARLCVRGKELLYEYCRQRGIPHKKIGKLIVAVDEKQVFKLDELVNNAVLSGVDDLERLDSRQVNYLEPEIQCTQALFSPSTGIIDSHTFMAELQKDMESNGAILSLYSHVTSIESKNPGLKLVVGGQDDFILTCEQLFNAAGLHASQLARTCSGINQSSIPNTTYVKGSYFYCSAKPSFSHLIYPLPEPGGLGVHVTMDLQGQIRFGPDVENIEAIDYCVDEARAEFFYDQIRTYWPGLPDSSLHPGYSGIRPKISNTGFPDFVISTEQQHGIKGLTNLYGFESPGLTASLAIAEAVASSANK